MAPFLIIVTLSRSEGSVALGREMLCYGSKLALNEVDGVTVLTARQTIAK